jgi:hypothetical protein
MTEEEWLACPHPLGVLSPAARQASPRKLRLFPCGCCRHRWHLLPGDFRRAVELSEEFADGRATRKALQAAAAVPFRAWRGWKGEAGDPPFGGALAAYLAARPLRDNSRYMEPEAVLRDMFGPGEGEAATRLIRCVFGNPFRPVTSEPSWLTTAVVALARQMYESRDFSAMPILADALQDAGCENADVLGHCRGGGPHVRGCWVVDLLLGKG